MFNKLANSADFIIELEKNQDILFQKNGTWLIDNKFNLFKKDRLQFARNFNEWFETLEHVPILFSKDPRVPLEQNADFLAYLDVANRVIKYLKLNPSKLINREMWKLQLSIIALNYRLEVQNGGFDKTSADYMQLQKLFQLATFWKKKQKIFWVPHLTTENIQQLFIACFYPKFVEFILKNVHLRELFFKWTIRDNLDPNSFIQFPGFHYKIRWANLHGRLARFGGDLLKVQKFISLNNEYYEKVLTLPIQGKDTSILDFKHQIEFKGKYFLTIGEILHIFHEKRFKIGNLEFLPDKGIINWNSYCLGWWSPEEKKYHVIDLDQEEWWTTLPYTEVINQETVKFRFCSEIEFIPGNWYLAAKASREYDNLSFQKTHAYLELAIPLPNGNYAIYNFGKFATKYPKTSWETIMSISSSVLGAIAYPDENIFYSHRQHVSYTFPLKPEQGLKCMASIKRDILLARQENVLFQVEIENCSQWVQNILEEQFDTKQLPNLFEIDILDTEPQHGFEGKLFSFMRSFPRYIQWHLIRAIHFVFGGWKGRYIVDKSGNKVWRSLYQSDFWTSAKVFLPSLLHKKQEDKHKKPFSSEENPVDAYIKKEVPPDFDPFSRLDIFEERNKTA